jgi:AcrR family transcriptional regulator
LTLATLSVTGKTLSDTDLTRCYGPPVSEDGARERLIRAAFTEFTANGFDATTVEQISDAAGVSRRTFFRYFATKEDVIFPDHDRLRAVVAADLERRRAQPPLAAVCAAVALVFDDYVRHRDVSLLRFTLTRSVTALRDREITSVYRYQRQFARHLREHVDHPDPLTAEVMAATVAAAHNNVLRDWLVGGASGNPTPGLATALDYIQNLFTASVTPSEATTAVAVFTLDTPVPDIIDAIHGLTAHRATVTQPAYGCATETSLDSGRA